ncbi:MAG: ATP-dependent protease ATPase subunit HslU [Rhodothermales bacterium]|nr:ATP-dependent protease ATPase subunit HslU [Rhodothermales bacterium]
MLSDLTPRQIVAELDLYVVGQADAKKSVAIALRNRWRRQHADEALREEIMPANILMIGPTGVGKTEIARRLARLAGAPFLKVEATKFTEVGYVGRDVDAMIRDLVDGAVQLVRAEHEASVEERAKERAEERLLEILIPGPASPSSKPAFPFGLSDAAASPTSDDATERARAKLRERLHTGEMDRREVEIEVTAESAAPTVQMFGPGGMEEMGMQLQDLFGGAQRKKKRRVAIPEALDLLAKEEAAKLVDMDAVAREAVRRAEQSGIVFIDEIDKVAVSRESGRGGVDVSREGVQRDLLPIVEGSTVTTKYGPVKTDHILFIASGAFHVAKPSDLIPELQGRFPIRVELRSLTEADFVQILTQPKNALLKQYSALLASEGVELAFTDAAVAEIAKIAAEVNAEVENIGARRLHTILTTLLETVLFDVPDEVPPGTLTVTDATVRERLAPIARNRDLSQYIL